jgi:hypothetical protein
VIRGRWVGGGGVGVGETVGSGVGVGEAFGDGGNVGVGLGATVGVGVGNGLGGCAQDVAGPSKTRNAVTARFIAAPRSPDLVLPAGSGGLPVGAGLVRRRLGWLRTLGLVARRVGLAADGLGLDVFDGTRPGHVTSGSG